MTTRSERIIPGTWTIFAHGKRIHAFAQCVAITNSTFNIWLGVLFVSIRVGFGISVMFAFLTLEQQVKLVVSFFIQWQPLLLQIHTAFPIQEIQEKTVCSVRSHFSTKICTFPILSQAPKCIFDSRKTEPTEISFQLSPKGTVLHHVGYTQGAVSDLGVNKITRRKILSEPIG